MQHRSANLYTLIYNAFHTLFMDNVSQTIITKTYGGTDCDLFQAHDIFFTVKFSGPSFTN